MDIKKPKLLLVEGKDEVVFFRLLCRKLNIGDIEVIESGGKDKFKDLLPAILNMRGIEKVTSIGVIRDADNSSVSAFTSIKHHFQKNGLILPNSINEIASENGKVSTGIFIMPGNRDTGMLENLMLDTVRDHPVKKMADRYIDELKENLTDEPPKFPSNEHKARFYAFLAGMEKFIPSLGLAAEKGYFDLDSSYLDDLKEFILKI